MGLGRISYETGGYHFTMTSISMAPPSGGDDKTSLGGGPTSGAQVTMKHDTGTIIDSDEAIGLEAQVETPYRLQPMPSNPLGEALARNVKIFSHVWDGTEAAFSTVGFDAFDRWITDAFVMDKLKNFKYIKCSIVIDIVVTAAPGCYGLLMVSNRPNGGEDLDADNTQRLLPVSTIYRHQICHVPHVRIDLALANNAEIRLPYMLPLEWAGTYTGYTLAGMWWTQIMVVSPIQSGMPDGSAKASAQVYARVENLELGCPVYQSGKGHLVDHAHEKRSHFNEKVKQHLGGKASELAAKASGFASSVASVPLIGSFAAPAAAFLSGASSVLDMFGFTRDTKIQDPTYVKTAGHLNLCNTDVTDVSEMAAYSAANMISFDPMLNDNYDSKDPGALDSLQDHWTLVRRVAWTSDAPTGTLLFKIPVTPFLQFPVSGDTTILALSPMAYAALPFSYWRGDMEYRMEVIVSKFHRGTIQAAWNYSDTIGGGVDPTNITRNAIMDISPGLSNKFTVGYASQFPCMRTAVYGDDGYLFNEAFLNGNLFFYVVNPLVGATATSSVDILLWSRPGKNFQFGVPQTEFLNYSVPLAASTVPLGTITYQGGLGPIGNDDFQTVEHELVPSSGDFATSELMWGETIKSVRMLMQKPVLLSMGVKTAGTGTDTPLSQLLFAQTS